MTNQLKYGKMKPWFRPYNAQDLFGQLQLKRPEISLLDAQMDF